MPGTSPSYSAPSPFEDPDLYDLLFGDFDLGLDFYRSLAREAGGPVLEIGCGTGRIFLPCLQAGLDIEGLDLYAPMLEALKRKAAARGLDPRLHEADMRGFTLPRRYALITIPFNGFAHCLTTEEQLGALRACREHLEPGGALAFDGFVPGPKFLGQADGSRVLELEVRHPRTGLPVRLYDTRFLDRLAQVQRSEMEIEELDAAGHVASVHRSETLVRWTYRAELELLLRAAGFPRVEIFGGFDRRPLEGDDAMTVVIVRRDGLGE